MLVAEQPVPLQLLMLVTWQEVPWGVALEVSRELLR